MSRVANKKKSPEIKKIKQPQVIASENITNQLGKLSFLGGGGSFIFRLKSFDASPEVGSITPNKHKFALPRALFLYDTWKESHVFAYEVFPIFGFKSNDCLLLAIFRKYNGSLRNQVRNAHFSSF